LKFGEHREHAEQLEDLLLPQRVDIRESLFGGVDGCVSCLSTSAGIPLNAVIGLPVSVQLMTDQGALHAINGIIVDAREGECDGAFTAYQILIQDALSLLERRTNTRVFRQMSVLDVIHTLASEWRQTSAVLAGAFFLDSSKVDAARFPAREQAVPIVGRGWPQSMNALQFMVVRPRGLAMACRVDCAVSRVDSVCHVRKLPALAGHRRDRPYGQ